MRMSRVSKAKSLPWVTCRIASDWCWARRAVVEARRDLSSFKAPMACLRFCRRSPLHSAQQAPANRRSSSRTGSASVGNGTRARWRASAKCWSGSKPKDKSGGRAVRWFIAPACFPSAIRKASLVGPLVKHGLRGPSHERSLLARHSK